MGRVIVGSLVAAIAMFIVGFIFFASGLQRIATASLEDTPSAAVQQALAANLPKTGTYFIPEPEASSAQTVMYGQGPVATIHYNVSGFPATDPTALIGGFVLNFLVALLIGTALIGIDRRVPDFGPRAWLVGLFSVAAASFMHLGTPLYYHHGWSHAIYLFVADAAALMTGGLIIARWFLPRTSSAPADVPQDA